MTESVKLSVPSHPQYLALIRRVTFTFGKVHGIDDFVMEEIRLAVDEACANVIKHAYLGDTSGNISITYGITKGEFRVAIDDNGIKVDTDAVRGRNLDELRPGGLGVHFIRKVFDKVNFDKRKKRGNRLILIKKVL